MQILTGHISPETAYLVESYPYGLRLRCKKRYWLDHHPKHGLRLGSQTTNPKAGGIVWNSAKFSTYVRFAAAMYLDEAGHVQWDGLTEYTNGAEAAAWRDKFGSAVPESCRKLMNQWVAAKLAYDAAKDAGPISATRAAWVAFTAEIPAETGAP